MVAVQNAHNHLPNTEAVFVMHGSLGLKNSLGHSSSSLMLSLTPAYRKQFLHIS